MIDPLVDHDRPVRIRPRAPKRFTEESRACPTGFRRVLHIFQMTRKAIRRQGSGTGASARRPDPRNYTQRCAVRITYSANKVKGQGGTQALHCAKAQLYLNPVTAASMPIRRGRSSSHCNWQKSSDPRLFKMILSPEFGERVDLRRLTRDLMARMSSDVGTQLEWVAVTHFNT
jgi:hypothetical protein